MSDTKQNNSLSPAPAGSEVTQFKPGASGNMAGRPKGSKNKSTLIKNAIELNLTEKLQHDAVEIYQKTVDMALKGDTTCIKILMDRLLPPRKASDDAVDKGVGGIQIIVQNMQPDGQSKTTIQGEVIRDVDDD